MRKQRTAAQLKQAIKDERKNELFTAGAMFFAAVYLVCLTYFSLWDQALILYFTFCIGLVVWLPIAAKNKRARQAQEIADAEAAEADAAANKAAALEKLQQIVDAVTATRPTEVDPIDVEVIS